jgi:hypothetical protein
VRKKPDSNWAVLDEDGNVQLIGEHWQLAIERVKGAGFIFDEWQLVTEIVNGYYVYLDFYGAWEDLEDHDFPKGWFDATVVSYDFSLDVETEHLALQADSRTEALARFEEAKLFAQGLVEGPHGEVQGLGNSY